MNGQGLRGFLGQGMDGRRPANDSAARTYPAGSWTFIVTSPGYYEVAGWSPGYAALNASPGVTGSFALKRAYLGAGQTLAITVGAANARYSSAGGSGANTASAVTFPDGTTMLIGVGNVSTGTAAVATGGDVNVNGTVSASTAAGDAGPSYGDYIGGPASSTAGIARAPGGAAPVSGDATRGGDGLVIVRRIR
jgi:hypothetical protein